MLRIRAGISRRQTTILVVEDEPLIRMLAVEMLEDAGCSVVEFDNAKHAIAFCKAPENDIAAVFTDINMPGDLDGLDLASLVIASRPGAVVVVTSGRYSKKPAALSPQVRFLPKPWGEPDLLSALQGVV